MKKILEWLDWLLNPRATTLPFLTSDDLDITKNVEYDLHRAVNAKWFWVVRQFVKDSKQHVWLIRWL